VQATDGSNVAARFWRPSWSQTVAQTLVLMCPSCLSCIPVSLARRGARLFMARNAEGPGTISVHRPFWSIPGSWIYEGPAVLQSEGLIPTKFGWQHGCAYRWAAARTLVERGVPSSIRCNVCLRSI
jgi:hypothetical protein